MKERLHRRWMGANAIGFVLGGALGGAVARAMEQPYEGTTSSPARGALILGVQAGVALGLFGLVIGVAQSLVLRGWVARAAWWAPATGLGWGAGGAVAGGLSGAIGGAVTDVGGDSGVWGFVVAAAVGVAAIAVLPGALQALVAGRGARRWAGVGAAGLGAGALVGFPLMLFLGNVLGLGLPSATAWGIGGLVMGLASGSVTCRRLDPLPRARKRDCHARRRSLIP
jgi:hypothetical protein